MQRTLEKSVQALESTALRLRRLSQPAARAIPASTGEPSKAPGSRGSAEAVPSGRVAHDARGNAIWNWATEASAIALESTSRLLKKLEIPELSVDDKPQGLSLEERDPGGGYDPYNRGKGGQGKR